MVAGSGRGHGFTDGLVGVHSMTSVGTCNYLFTPFLFAAMESSRRGAGYFIKHLLVLTAPFSISLMLFVSGHPADWFASFHPFFAHPAFTCLYPF